MKKLYWTVLFLGMILIISILAHGDTVYNGLTVGQGDARYCLKGSSDCGGSSSSSSGGNQTIISADMCGDASCTTFIEVSENA